MKLVKVNAVDVYRDGGSYGASFQTDDDLTYSLWLQRSKMPDREGRHHRWLFEYFGLDRPSGCLPIVTGSTEEMAILDRLKEVLDVWPASMSAGVDFDRIREFVHHIEHREPCLPSDRLSWHEIME